MKKRIITMLIFAVALLTVKGASIGSWNAYMAFGKITEIAPAGNMVYVLSSNDLFSYNVNDQSIQTYNKMNALSDCDITHIAWCNSAKRLIIIYADYNIDLLDQNGNVTNISDLYSKTMTGDKTVNSITVDGYYAYLSTGFGVIKLNVKNAEITDTYNLDKDVLSSAIYNNSIYAATKSEGIWQAPLTSNLLDKSNWTKNSDNNVERLYNFDGKLVSVVNFDNCYLTNGKWVEFYNTWHDFSAMNDGKLMLGRKNCLIIFNSITDVHSIENQNGRTALTYDATNKCFWSNNPDGGMEAMEVSDDNVITVKTENIKPDGPKYNYFGFMKYYNGSIYTAGGGYSTSAELNREGTVQIYNNDSWTIYEDSLNNKTGVEYVDVNSVDIDPTDATHVFASGRSGLYEFRSGKFVKLHTTDNSPLEAANVEGGKNYVLTMSILFDAEGNLWCLNSQAPNKTSLLEYTKDGKWVDHKKTELIYDDMSLGLMTGMMKDSRGLIWFCNDHWMKPGLFCYQPSTDAMNSYFSFINEDGTTLSISGVHCVAEDKDNNIWVGTTSGPLQLTSSAISSGSTVFNQVKVPRNDGTNYADYLLDGANVVCMAVDGGGRKWFGTNNNGVYLISADNMTQVQHFLTTNSKLLSDNVESITINDKTGEVFFGTDKGLCSYMSDASATNDKMTKDNVWAYPNPVKPDYTGLITVTGLTYDADVKIVTSNGVLVAKGRSNGGTFTWDGCDQDGKKVVSGVYMVETATSDGNEGTVCKIAIVR